MKKKQTIGSLPEIANLEIDGMPIDREAVKDIQVKLDKTGTVKEYLFTVEQSFRDALRYELFGFSTSKKITQEQREQIKDTYEFITTNIKELTPPVNNGKLNVSWLPKTEIPKEKVIEHLERDYTVYIMTELTKGGWKPQQYTWEGEATRLRGNRWRIKPREKKRKPKIRIGAYLIGNMLKGKKPNGKQLSIFDTMLQETKDKVISSGTSIDLINRKGEGIKLTKGEYRVLLCLSNILHDKSQTKDPKADDFYTGDGALSLVLFPTNQGEIQLKSPSISFTLYEIAKEFHGGESIGGEQVRKVGKLLYALAEDPAKKALIRYTRRVDKGKGLEREYFIEAYDSLIKINTIGYKDFLSEKQIDERKEIIVKLHPIFIDQIADKYIEHPRDLAKRMIEANGGSNISEIVISFIMELTNAYSGRKTLSKDQNGNPIYRIGKEKLFYKIAEGYLPPNKRRMKEIKKFFDKGVKNAIAIGLLLSYETKPGDTGEDILYFTLSKDWE